MTIRHALSAFLVAASISTAALADPADELQQLAEDYNAFELAEDPIAAAREGDMEAARRLPDVGPEALARRKEAVETFLDRTNAIDPDALDAQGRASLGLLRHELNRRMMAFKYDTIRIPFLNDSGFHTTLDYVARQTRIARAGDAEALLARYKDYPRYLAQYRAHMARGIETGWTQPGLVVDRAIEILKNSQVGTDPRAHSLFQPFASLPAAIPADKQDALQEEAARVLARVVGPALRDTLAFMEQDYRPAARPGIGISSLENGAAYYAELVRSFTSTDITPKQVHEIGLAEVARIRTLMNDVIEEVGFDGDFAAFLDFLRTDEQFYPPNEQALLERASYLAKQADGKMPRYFATLPRLSYGVIPVPAEIAPAYTTGRYWRGSPEQGVAGYYVVNTYDLPSRPFYELPALTLHEGVPGHHHQIALAQELENLPAFRKRTRVTAFSEGWGLYAEYLGEEMGMYRTPYERFGRYSYEMWRACRLVVDTGIHAFGWSREKAEQCFRENSALSQQNITTELDRYIAWPGQATAYKIGELKIKELRARAEQELGDAFDVRTFHDAVLEDGAVTLSILESKIGRWIAAQK